MDYLKFVEHHRATNADITIGCLPVDYERASDFGLMKIDDEGRIYVSACMWHSAGLPKHLVSVGFMEMSPLISELGGVLRAGLCREAKGGCSGGHEGGHDCPW